MLRVAQALLDLDGKFDKGEDIDNVKKGYTERLLHAMSSKDKLYEVEVLKSLGDVSLHNGRRYKNDGDFKRAVRLYNAALKRCDDPNVQESLEHRAAFASLFSRNDQDEINATDNVEETSTTQVSEMLPFVGKTQKTTDFNAARQSYANILVSAIMGNDKRLEVEVLKSIGDISLDEGKFNKNTAILGDAISFYRGALCQCEESDGRETLLHRIGYAERIDEQISSLKAKGGETGMLKVKQKLSTVAEQFRKLDMMLKSNSDLDAVERGYASKLIHAISTENDVLKGEALKSLGDLYLHKAKMKEHMEENFKKASALYKELLRHFKSKEEREVVQHRVKYAEKCAKLPGKCVKPEGEVSGNVTLSVALTLHDVKEKIDVKRRGVMPLIEGYTGLFVVGIVNRNKRLEMESLKSLGDLYQEKGRVDEDNAAFTKAGGLYRAAMDRCEDSDDRETVQHRMKYTEKLRLTKEKKRRETRQQNAGEDNLYSSPTTRHPAAGDVTGQRDSGRIAVAGAKSRAATTHDKTINANISYEQHLKEGSRALQTGDLDRAEQNFAAALKSVHIKDAYTSQHCKEAEALYKLSDVYLKRGKQSNDGSDFTKAAALCNAALVRSKTDDTERIKQTALEITKAFAQHVLNIEQTVDIGVDRERAHKSMLKKDRNFVEREIKRIEEQMNPYSLDDEDPDMKEMEKQRAEAIQELCEVIVHQRRNFVSRLVNECMDVMGTPPCKYAMAGLGSQATGLVTPYSDLEFAVFVEQETEDNIKYFRNLTHYLHLKVINLGETILPAMAIKSLNDFESDNTLDNWFYDSATPRGFSFDGAMPHACKTPLGRGKACELIRTPCNMTKVLKDDITLHLKKGYHLVTVLGNVCLIIGAQDLVDEYTTLWTQQLRETNGVIPFLEAISTLKENAPMFKVGDLTDSLLNVKKDMYRFSSLAVSCWALLRGIQPTTIWETIRKLNKKGVIDSDNAHHLMVLVSISAELRLRTYMINGGQVENVSALSSMSNEGDMGKKLKKVFYFSNTKQLMRYYYTALPLKAFISQLTDSRTAPRSSSLFNNSSSIQAEVYRSLCDYQQWKVCAERTLQEDLSEQGKSTVRPDIASSMDHLGGACSSLGDYRKAISYHEQSLQIWRNIHGEGTPHPDTAGALNHLGNAWNGFGDHRKAIGYFDQSLQMLYRIYGESKKHPDIAMLLGNLGSAHKENGDYEKAVHYLEKSLQMRRNIYGKNAVHSDIATSLNNLGIGYSDLGEQRKAYCYYEQSLQMSWVVYGENTAHPFIAQVLNNLGTTCTELGDYKKAVNYYGQALQMQRRVYGENTAHPEIATSCDNLGSVCNKLGDYKKAISYHEKSKQMRMTIYSENTAHPDIAASLHNLGNTWSELGDHRKAISYFEQSLQMLRCIHGKTIPHADIAASLNSLGSTWNDLGDHKKAVSYYEQSLKMQRGIYGEDTPHPDIVMSLNNLGNAWNELGDYREAVSYYNRSLQMLRSIHGEDTAHPDIAGRLNNLGSACRSLCDYRKAVNYHEQALQMQQSIYGKNTPHPDITKSLNNMGSAWRDLGDYEKAYRFYSESLQMMQNIYGGEDIAHSDIAKVLNNLGEIWNKLGDHNKAISCHEKSLQMQRIIFGENTEHSAGVLNNLGVAYSDLGDYRKAVSYYEQSLHIRRGIYGEDTAHPGIVRSMVNLGIAWRKLGDFRKATSLLEQSLEIQRRIYGEETAHIEIAVCLGNLGTAWEKLGNVRKAIGFYEQSLEAHQSIYGKGTAHPMIAKLCTILGDSWDELGEYKKAISSYEHALQMQRSLHSEDTAHPDIASLLKKLGILCRKHLDIFKAFTYLNEAAEIQQRWQKNKNYKS